MRELPKGSGWNIKITKTPNQPKLKLSDPDTVSDEILPEYRLDYSKARPNRFAELAAKAAENERKTQAVAEAIIDERPASAT